MLFLKPMTENELRQWPIVYRDSGDEKTPPLMANIRIEDEASGEQKQTKIFLDRLGLFILVLSNDGSVESKISAPLNYAQGLAWARLFNVHTDQVLRSN